MSAPLVSVVIPVRNGLKFIDEAIDSVLIQSFADLEIIVVNDGSTDGEYDSLQAKDPRIRVLHLDGHGVSYARNFGVAASQGALIAFLDADDAWFPGKLVAQVRYMHAHADVGVVFGGYDLWHADADGTFAPATSLARDCSDVTRADADRSGWLYTRLLMGLLVGMNTAVVRRSIFDAVGGFKTTTRIAEDCEFWLAASRLSEMHALAGSVALYRIHRDSAMLTLPDTNPLLRVLVDAYERWGLSGPGDDSIPEAAFAARIAEIQFGFSYAHFWSGSARLARDGFRASLRARYRVGKSALYLALTYLPTWLTGSIRFNRVRAA